MRVFLGLVFTFWFLGVPSLTEAAIISKPPTNLGLVGYWSFNEGGGSYVNDLSGSNNKGVFAGSPTWVDGKRGKALDFDGIDDYIDAGVGSSLDITNTITLAYWMNPRSKNRMILGRRSGCSGGGMQYHMHLMSDGVLHFNANSAGVSSSLYPTLGQWNFVAVTYESTGQTGTFYLNDQSPNNFSAAGSMPSIGAVSLKIGSYGTCPDPFDGLLDEVRVYNRMLSATEIRELYKISMVKYAAPSDLGLVGYWPMNEGTSTRAKDFSGNGNNGVLTSFPAIPTWVDGRRGKALNFDGSDDFINLQDSNSLDLTNAATISVWVKLDKNNNANGQAIIARSTNGYILAIYSPTYGVTAFRNKITWSKNGVDEIVSNSTVTLGRWFHIAATHDNGTRKIYVNSVEDGTGSKANFNALSDEVFIGKQSAAGWNFQGTIDELRLYKRVLSAAEVYALYKSGTAAVNVSQNDKLANGLVGFWSFNGPDMSGATAYDRSGQGNNGTLTNGPAFDGGKVGQALSFDGVDDYVSLPGPVLSSTNTVVMWIYIRNFDTLYGNLFGNTGCTVCIMTRTATNKLDFFYSSAFHAANTILKLGTWYHIAVVSSAGNVSFYLNGLPDGTASGAPGYTAATMGDNAGAGEHNGLIDEVRVYNRALSPDEIKRLYNMGR